MKITKHGNTHGKKLRGVCNSCLCQVENGCMTDPEVTGSGAEARCGCPECGYTMKLEWYEPEDPEEKLTRKLEEQRLRQRRKGAKGARV
jgi:hypothetical protein